MFDSNTNLNLKENKENADIRAFAAVPVTEEAADGLEKFLRELRPLARLRWVTREQFHITLRFLGEQTPAAIERVKDALAPLTFRPFDVTISRAGVFPDLRRPRVLWLSCSEGREELTALAGAVNDALHAAGFPREERAFKPHLTLARMNGTPLPQTLLKTLEGVPSLSWRCNGFVLMRSRLTPRGAVYSSIREFKF